MTKYTEDELWHIYYLLVDELDKFNKMSDDKKEWRKNLQLKVLEDVKGVMKDNAKDDTKTIHT